MKEQQSDSNRVDSIIIIIIIMMIIPCIRKSIIFHYHQYYYEYMRNSDRTNSSFVVIIIDRLIPILTFFAFCSSLKNKVLFQLHPCPVLNHPRTFDLQTSGCETRNLHVIIWCNDECKIKIGTLIGEQWSTVFDQETRYCWLAKDISNADKRKKMIINTEG